MPTPIKNGIVSILLASVLTIAFLSFAMMVHGADGSMVGDCPLTAAMGSSLCPENMLDMAMSHFGAYHSFFVASPDIAAPLIGLLLLSLILIAFSFLHLFRVHLLAFRPYGSSPAGAESGRKRTRWFSLLEHSPSLA